MYFTGQQPSEKIRKFALSVLLCSLYFWQNTVFADNDKLSFKQVWIAEAPPVSKVLAAYMQIENTTDKDIQVVSVDTDAFSSTAFHRTIYKDGMASMQHQTSMNITAGSSLELKPGSFHMMLFNPVKPLSAGDKVLFTFALDNGEKIMVTATVKKAGI